MCRVSVSGKVSDGGEVFEEEVSCPGCGEAHWVQWANDGLLGYVSCGSVNYLVIYNGREEEWQSV